MNSYKSSINIEKHNGVYVLRDDLLLGGTKSIFIPDLLESDRDYYVYASPVYGGFQIALSGCCKKTGKHAVIFCAKRKQPHKNSLLCKKLGARVLQVPYGYLSNIQSKAKIFCKSRNAQLLEFGANTPLAINAIAERMRGVIEEIGGEPGTVFCAVGSGTLLKGIIKGTSKSKIIGVQVGREVNDIKNKRVEIIKYGRPFDKPARIKFAPFPSCENYDLKAWEVCVNKASKKKNVFFWNVL